MTFETWRVIDADGAEHTATVDVRDGDDAAALTVAIGRGGRDTYHRATEIRAAIAHRAWADDIAVAEILAPGQPSRTTPAWGPLPTAAEVDAHVARSSPARASDGAPWAYRCADSSGDYVAIIYLRTEKDEVTSCEPGHAVWYRLRAWHRKSQWRPVDGDGMPVERVR
jgi:hypothetical protein